MSKNSWYVPVATMKETERQRNKRELKEESPSVNSELFHCRECGVVWRTASHIYKKDRNGCEQEVYSKGVMPTYGLRKRPCLNCINKKELVNG